MYKKKINCGSNHNNISEKSDSQWRKLRIRIILLILSNIKVPGTITILCCQIFLSSVQKHQTLEVQKTMNVRKSHFCRLNYWRRKWLKFSNFSKIQYLFCTRKSKSKTVWETLGSTIWFHSGTYWFHPGTTWFQARTPWFQAGTPWW